MWCIFFNKLNSSPAEGGSGRKEHVLVEKEVTNFISRELFGAHTDKVVKIKEHIGGLESSNDVCLNLKTLVLICERITNERQKRPGKV